MKPLSWYRETYIRDKYKCVYCGKDMKNNLDSWLSLQIDHIVPASKGGKDNIENRATSCNVCNLLKLDYLPDNWELITKKQLVDKMSKFIKSKRDKWKIEYKKALKEYEKATFQKG